MSTQEVQKHMMETESSNSKGDHGHETSNVSTISLTLTHYDLFNFERGLGLSAKRTGWIPKNCTHLNMMYCRDERVPIGASYIFGKFEDNSDMTVTVTLRADDVYVVEEAKTIVDFSGPSRKVIIPFGEEFKNILKVLVPEKYFSLEQWVHYNPRNTVTNVARLTDNMIPGGIAIIKKYFGNLPKRGTFPYNIKKDIITYRSKDEAAKEKKEGGSAISPMPKPGDKEKAFTVNEANLVVLKDIEIIWVLELDENPLFQTDANSKTITLKVVYQVDNREKLKSFLDTDFEGEILDAFIRTSKKFDGFLNPIRDL